MYAKEKEEKAPEGATSSKSKKDDDVIDAEVD